MDKKEFNLFAKALKTFYPRENLLPNEQAMEMWFRMLSDIPYQTAITWLQKWISTEKWPPTIAEIRGGVNDITAPDIGDWSEAWEEVNRAVSRYGFMREAEALNSLSPLARAAITRLGWKAYCESSVDDMSFRANFRDIYNSLAKRESENRSLPPSLASQLLSMSNNLMLEDKHG